MSFIQKVVRHQRRAVQHAGSAARNKGCLHTTRVQWASHRLSQSTLRARDCFGPISCMNTITMYVWFIIYLWICDWTCCCAHMHLFISLCAREPSSHPPPPHTQASIQHVLVTSLHSVLQKSIQGSSLVLQSSSAPFFPLCFPPNGRIKSGNSRSWKKALKASVFPYVSSEICTHQHSLTHRST